MAECFARILGDCSGSIEDEHFISKALQRMLGSVTVAGLKWQEGTSSTLPPTSYAHGRILCRHHHDQLDGLDGNAAAYFRNLMLIANPNHVSTGAPGQASDIAPLVNGRGLEKWFLKMICGAIATGSVERAGGVQNEWIAPLFDRVSWPDQWAMYFVTETRTATAADGALNFDFVWADDKRLQALVSRFLSIETLFSLEVLDETPDLLRRPRLLGAKIERPGGGPALRGLSVGEDIRFLISWPDEPLLDESEIAERLP